MLRHTFGLLAGLLAAPLLWIGVAWPVSEAGAVLRDGNAGNLDSGMVLPALGVLMLVGALCGLLAGSRISPLAAFLSGGLVLAFCLWPLLHAPSLNATLPDWLGSGSMFHPVGPALMIALPLSTLLFVSALMPSRWRSRHAAPRPAEGHPGPAGSADPGTPPSRADAPYPTGPDAPTGTTTPFRRDPETGIPRSTGWGAEAPDSTRAFRRDDQR